MAGSTTGGRPFALFLGALAAGCAFGGDSADAGRDAAASPDASCDDADSDGVCDAADVCDGYDDALDADADGVPDSCDCDRRASFVCAMNADCEDGTDGVICTCPEGTTGDGRTCEAIGCGALAPPDRGTVSLEGTGPGTVATYACEEGYSLVGDATRVCDDEGVFSGSAPTCELVDCGAPPPISGGTVDASMTTSGRTATYACLAGHVMEGEPTRTCQSDGAWSGAAPSCRLVDCGGLTPIANGSVIASGTSYGSTASYSCSAGYGLTGDAMRTCQADGTWSGATPSCDPASCGSLPAIANGSVSAPITTLGATATYACDGGYTLSGAATRMCQVDGTWSGSEPICTIVSCGGLPSPAQGTVTLSGMTYGSTATYACDPGFDLSDLTPRICQADGTWSGAAPSCDPVSCGPLGTIPNGSVSVSGTTYGSTATYSCSAGYTLSGGATRACQADGMWSGVAPSCAPVSCGSLPNPANGAVSLSGTTFGSTATYACDVGYSLVGASTRSCASSGAWSGVAPTCQATCPIPPSPTNGSVTYTGRSEGSTATYSCNAGYVLTAASHNRCGPSGWVGATPTCRVALSCACGGVYAQGDRVRATVAAPSGASGVALGDPGTAVAGSTTAGTLELLMSWDIWTSGHTGNCSVATCGTCTEAVVNERWWTACAGIATQRLSCACGGAFTPGDRVVATVDGPASASGILRGHLGTVVAGGTGTLPILIQWDGWASGHNGNCSASACGGCTASATNNRWYVPCEDVGRAP